MNKPKIIPGQPRSSRTRRFEALPGPSVSTAVKVAVGIFALFTLNNINNAELEQSFRVDAKCAVGAPAMTEPQMIEGGGLAGSIGTSRVFCPRVPDGKVESVAVTGMQYFNASSPFVVSVGRNSLLTGAVFRPEAGVVNTVESTTVAISRIDTMELHRG